MKCTQQLAQGHFLKYSRLKHTPLTLSLRGVLLVMLTSTSLMVAGCAATNAATNPTTTGSNAPNLINPAKQPLTQAQQNSRQQRLHLLTTVSNVNINAGQAVAIAQQQAGTQMQAVGVHFHGAGYGARQGRYAQANPQNTPSTQAATLLPAHYRVQMLSSIGQASSWCVNANSGQLLDSTACQSLHRQPPRQRGNQMGMAVAAPMSNATVSNGTASNDTAISNVKISLSQALQAAEAGSGGKAIRAQLQYPRLRQASAAAMAATPHYGVNVVKDEQLYWLRVDANTGKVIETVSGDDGSIRRHGQHQGQGRGQGRQGAGKQGVSQGQGMSPR